MENRSVTPQDFVAIPQTSTDQAMREAPLPQAEVHLLVEFFQLLDRWDQELVQNENICRKEVMSCRVQ
jgi:hypothetical protein